MEILVSGPNDWTQFDAENLVKFLETETGKRFLPKITEQVPVLFDGGDTNKILIRSGEVRAFNLMLEHVMLLAHPPAPVVEPASEYPAPEDDKAWNDGQRLEQPQT